MSGRGSRSTVRVGLCSVAIALVLGAQVGAQEPFVSYDFETGGLEDFFLPIGADVCGTLVPSGTAEIKGGEVVLSTDDSYGIGMFSLLPEVVERTFPESRDAKTRARFMIDEGGPGGQVTQFECGIRARAGVDEVTGLIDSSPSAVYYISVVPEFVSFDFEDGYIGISEFARCHDDVEHPEWPLGDGFAAAGPGGFAIVPEEWYWLEVTAIGDDDGGPVTLSAAVWPDGDDPPETPQLTVVDPDGLNHTADTLRPENDLGLFFGLNFDLEPRPVGASVRIDDITVTQVVPRTEEERKVAFRRGDANDDGTVNLTDGVLILNFLFTDLVKEVPCEESSDANDDGTVNLTDGLFILNFLFVESSAAPPAPGPETCGENPADEDLTECSYTSC